MDEAVADLFHGLVEFHADHQSLSAYFLDLREFFQFFQQIPPHGCCVFYQMLLLYYVHHSQCCRTGKVIATESRSQHAVNWFEHRANQYPCHREAVSDSFGYGDDIRPDACVLMGEEFPAAAVSALYFIQDEDSAVLRTGCPEFPEEFPGRYL